MGKFMRWISEEPASHGKQVSKFNSWITDEFIVIHKFLFVLIHYDTQVYEKTIRKMSELRQCVWQNSSMQLRSYSNIVEQALVARLQIGPEYKTQRISANSPITMQIRYCKHSHRIAVYGRAARTGRERRPHAGQKARQRIVTAAQWLYEKPAGLPVST